MGAHEHYAPTIPENFQAYFEVIDFSVAVEIISLETLPHGCHVIVVNNCILVNNYSLSFSFYGSVIFLLSPSYSYSLWFFWPCPLFLFIFSAVGPTYFHCFKSSLIMGDSSVDVEVQPLSSGPIFYFYQATCTSNLRRRKWNLLFSPSKLGFPSHIPFLSILDDMIVVVALAWNFWVIFESFFSPFIWWMNPVDFYFHYCWLLNNYFFFKNLF